MEQSIASSQGNIGAGKRPGRNAISIFAGQWSAMTANRSKFTSNIWHFRNSLGSDISETLDIDKISARLDIENRAESDGKSDQPRSTEEGVSGTQREIVVYFRKLRRRARHQVTELAEKLRGLSEEIDLLGVGGSLRDIPSRCENKVVRLIAECQSELNFLGERETQQQQHYAALLEKSQLNQDAERPQSPVFRWIFMAVLIGVGALAIAKISVSGFGSADLIPPSWTISISLIVVLASSVIARAASRPINHVGQIRQLTRWLGSGLGIAFIVMMALIAADYIAAVTANPGAAVSSVVRSILVDPIAIVTDVADWKGFGIVISAGLMAFLVSYRPDSSHPGHGAIQSATYRTRRKRDRLTKRLRMHINAIIDEADVEVTELPKQLKARINQYSKLVDESKRISVSLSDYDVALEDSCSILLDRYRAANTNARKSEVPVSFSEHICFRPEHKSNVSVFGEEEGRLEQLHQGIDELEGEAIQVRLKLRDLNSSAISALEETPTSV